MSFRGVFIFLACFWGFSSFILNLQAQERYDVQYHFQKDSIKIEPGRTFSNTLLIRNTSNQTVHLIRTSQDSLSLLGIPPEIVLKAKESRAFPVKYLADRRTIHSKEQAFSYTLKPSDKRISVQEQARFFTRLEQRQGLILEMDQDEVYLDPNGKTGMMTLRVTNTGLLPLDVQLEFSAAPQGLEFIGETGSIVLESGAQRLLPFTVQRTSGGPDVDYRVILNAMRIGGERLNSYRFQVRMAGSVKRYFNPNQSAGMPDNMLGLRYRDLNGAQSIYQVLGQGHVQVQENAALQYSLHMDYFQGSGGINLYDTYLGYQAEKWGVQIGNIYENLDYSLSGRGIKLSYHLNDSSSLHFYGAENQYMLVNRMDHFVQGAKVLGAAYTFNWKNQEAGVLQYLHTWDLLRGLKTHLLSGSTPLHLSDSQALEIEGGYSMEQAGEGKQQSGFAAGVQYSFRKSEYRFHTRNYYSSPYYTGLRRGLLQSDSRIMRQIGSEQQVSARISLMNQQPRYQPGDWSYGYERDTRVHIYELGYRLPWAGIQWDIRPYWMHQYLRDDGSGILNPNQVLWRSESIRTLVNMGYGKADHRFQLRADYGYTFKNTSAELSAFHSFRFNGRYNYKQLGLSAYLQLNPYYLSDRFRMDPNTPFRIYSLGPDYRFSAFQNQLRVQISGTYHYYGRTQSHNHTFNGQARWRLKGNWNLTADFFYTILKSEIPLTNGYDRFSIARTFNNRQINIGIEKRFGENLVGSGKKLDLLYFQDRNGNGRLDDSETRVEGVLVRLGGMAGRTDEQGLVRFKNLPQDAYTINSVHSGGWIAQGSPEIYLNRNTRLEIPLTRTAVLQGNIKVALDKYQTEIPSLSGIRIQAIDTQGKHYSTLSNNDGSYRFFLMPGSYTVFIETDGLPFSIDNARNTIELSASENRVQVLDFVYRDQRRKIKIKRF